MQDLKDLFKQFENEKVSLNLKVINAKLLKQMSEGGDSPLINFKYLSKTYFYLIFN